VAAIDPVPVGQTSVPIRISTENPPHTSVTISIEFTNPTLDKFSIHPDKLTFTYDVSELYFTIQIAEDYTADV
jgi:hypothetical protein